MAKKNTTEHENHERWLVSYADFITLLFAFFVVLYATSQADVNKQKQFEQSIQKFMLGAGTKNLAAPADKGSSTNEQEKMDSPIEDVLERNRSTEASELLKQIETYLETNMSASDMRRIVRDLDVSEWGARIVLDSDYIFAGASDKFQRSALNSLDTILEFVARSNKKTIIESHSDNGQLNSPDYISYWELTAHRATTLARYLIKRHDMPAGNLVPIGFADQRAIVPNDTAFNRQKNRRIEILISTVELDL